MAQSPPLLELRHVSRRHPDGQRWLLEDISLAIEAGERVALVGPTGSGKTLLLRAMVLLDPLSRGEVCWRGRAVGGEAIPDFRRQAVYLPQRPTLREETVEAALRQPYWLKVYRDRQFDRAGVVSLLAALGRDEDFLTKHSRDLSGGERQMTALVRALQLEPTLLLLDEPTAALDGRAVAAAEQLLGRWVEEDAGRALVWVSHDPGLAERVAKRRIVMREGTVESCG